MGNHSYSMDIQYKGTLLRGIVALITMVTRVQSVLTLSE